MVTDSKTSKAGRKITELSAMVKVGDGAMIRTGKISKSAMNEYFKGLLLQIPEGNSATIILTRHRKNSNYDL